MLIEGSMWPEPVEIKKTDTMAGETQIVGVQIPSGKHVDVNLTREELESLSFKKIDCNFTGESWKAFLSLETIRYRFAWSYDPLLAMSTSKIEPLPHQIDAVYGHVLRKSKIRFLLAHDPGAGKTVMAGLIIKEMKLRHIAKRILIVVPGHLKDQWQRELKDKFEEPFVIADRGTASTLYVDSIWNRENQLITSMDFAKRDDMLESLKATQFNLIVVDEAHKMSADKYGEKIDKTKRYRLGEILSANSEHLLFLSATPHKGDSENFRLFLDLLEPGYFATTEMLAEYLAKDENTLFLRQIKEDMKNFDGTPLFLPRHVDTLAYSLSDPEWKLYREVTSYVQNQFNRALASGKKRSIGFALIVLQRRLASSSFALWKSLQRRRDRLLGLLDDFERSKQKTRSVTFDFEDIEDMTEEQRWERESVWEALSIAENRDELKKEIHTLEGLVRMAKNVIDGDHEIKITKLRDAMIKLDTAAREKGIDNKMLIFTESKDTLEYLEKRVKSWGYDVCTIHGGMKLDDRVEAERIFKSRSQVMIATEAAGEGINLQFCHLMINYDIPWNPNRLEQRMGRIHRYGQKYEVYVTNLVASDTIEGHIFKHLFDKLHEIKDKMGNDKVYDIMGQIYYGKDLAQMLVDAAVGARTEDEVLREMEITVDDDYVMKIRENLTDTLATRYIDFARLGHMQEVARENRLMPEYTSEFFTRALTRSGGRIRKRSNGLYAVDSIPTTVRDIGKEDAFKRSYGSLSYAYHKVTFDKYTREKNLDAELLTFGHPLFEAVLEWVSRMLGADLKRGSVFCDRTGQMDGTILFFEGVINDGTGRIAGRRLFAHYVDSNTNCVVSVPSSVLWDLDDVTGTCTEPVDLKEQKNAVQEGVIKMLREYKEELLDERKKQTAIKEKHAVRSLEKLIHDLDADLVGLLERQQKGENVDIAIHNKTERQRKHIEDKNELLRLIEQEKGLTVSTPTFLGIVRVVPAKTVSDDMIENIESEKTAMDVAMAFERLRGRTPIDVSRTVGLGYDIKSSDLNETRYIEVKGRYKVGQVALTRNEWFKAKQMGSDYYLYVVWNTLDTPASQLQPMIIRDPANNTNPKADTYYVIDADDIRKAAA